MVSSLDEAQTASADPPDSNSLTIVHHAHAARGRPRIEIDPYILQYAMELRPNTAIATLFGCSARTVRRRALDHRLVNPSPPVSTLINQQDGTQTIRYTPFTPTMTILSDQELDRIMGGILETFPSFGRQMIMGQFRLYGLRVSRQRLRDSYIRVVGPPPEFGGRRIKRRVYRVAGPNALSHHDGWHGMCR
jgi:hypothetical protein